jgi:hypothetical protein
MELRQLWLMHETAESLFFLHVLAECQDREMQEGLLHTELVKLELMRWFETLHMKQD